MISKIFLESRDDEEFQQRMKAFGDELAAMREKHERCMQDNDQILGGLSSNLVA